MRDKIKPGWYRDQQREALANMDYFSWNKCKYALQSPKAFYRHYAQNKVKEPTKAMDFGSMVHLAALEPAKFRDRFIEQPDFGDMRSSTNRKKRDDWQNEQRRDALIVTQEDMGKLVEMVENIMDHPGALKLLTGGRSEGWGYVFDEEFGRWQLIRPDFTTNNLITVELKTTSKWFKDADAWAREAFYTGYDGQLAHNTRGNSMLHGLKESNRKGAWVVVQSVEPFEVWVFTCGEQLMLSGETKCFKAYHRINDHLERDPEMKNPKLWPGVQGGKAHEANAAPWMLEGDKDFDDITQANQP